MRATYAIMSEGRSWLHSLGPLANQAMGLPEMVDVTIAEHGRICTLCKEWKTAENFGVHKRRGLKPWCKSCRNLRQQEDRRAAADHFRRLEKESRQRREPFTGYARFMRNRGYVLKYKFGISLDEYLALWEGQNRRCAICATDIKPFTYKEGKGHPDATCVDHDHKTGKVRGLLCHPCNKAIGLLGDEFERVSSAAAYLGRHR